jgi:M6 family metalloprotease-like protein
MAWAYLRRVGTASCSVAATALRCLLAGILGLAAVPAAVALTPPFPGELQRYEDDGSYQARLDRALQLGNNQIAPRLMRRLLNPTAADTPSAQTPPPVWQGGLPTTGTVKTFALLVDFPDQPHTSAQTTTDVASKLFGDGDYGDYPYESLRNYYQRSSYQQLTITGTVLGWYRANHDRFYYSALDYPAGNLALVKEALAYFDGQGHDFAQYDNDGDGVIDGFFIKWTGPDEGWSSFWWGYQGRLYDASYQIDGKSISRFVWSWYANPDFQQGDDAYHARVDIHETGHLLGLPDYYDYDANQGPDGGLGGLDMMDRNLGDHNCFSKMLLDWVTPTVVGSAGSQTHAFLPSGDVADCVLAMPGGGTSIFNEYFLVQYRRNDSGNDVDYPSDGLTIWHVDARLSGGDYLYDNSYTVHKLLRLMEADGREQIESNGYADAGDFYTAGDSLGDTTTPSSRRYDGSSTELFVDSIGSAGSSLSARIGIGGGGSATQYTLSVSVSGNGNVISSPYLIDCGSTCSGSFASDSSVLLTATPSSGASFLGWGGACSGTAQTCSLSLSSDQSVSASFSGSSGGADLLVTAFDADSSAQIGGNIYVSATVTNQGGASAAASNLGFYFSSDNSITSSDTFSGWVCPIPTLAAGESVSCEGFIVVPSSLGSGSYYVGCYADMDGAISEGNENNNGRAASHTTTLGSDSPDLVITAFTAPASAQIGDTLSVSLTVRNQGSIAAGAFDAAFYFSKDANITLGDIATAWYCSWSSLAAGATSTCSGDIAMPTGLAAGTYYVGAYADNTEQVGESNEANNGLAATHSTVISGASSGSELSSGVTVTGSVAYDGWNYYHIAAASIDTGVDVRLYNLTADADLYVSRNGTPDIAYYDCASYNGRTAEETCSVTNTGATDWYIGVYGYHSAGYSLVATLAGGDPGTGSDSGQRYAQMMFLGYFGRPGTPTAVEYYGNLVDAGNVAALYDDFWNNSQALFGGLPTEARVTLVFQHLFGRAPAQAGLSYWTGEIDSGRVSLPAMVMAILDAANASDPIGSDMALFNARVGFADALDAAMDTSQEVLAYQHNVAAAYSFTQGLDTVASANAAAANGQGSLDAILRSGGIPTSPRSRP